MELLLPFQLEKFRGFFMHPASDTCSNGGEPPNSINFTIKARDYSKACKKAAQLKPPTCKKCGVKYQMNNIMN